MADAGFGRASPLHSAPRCPHREDELIAKLKSLTNFRVVRDPDSAEGWKVELDTFPGWEKVPECGETLRIVLERWKLERTHGANQKEQVVAIVEQGGEAELHVEASGRVVDRVDLDGAHPDLGRDELRAAESVNQKKGSQPLSLRCPIDR